MLKQRVITAVFLAAVSLWALYGWSDAWFAGYLLVATAACAWEWSSMGNMERMTPRAVFAGLVTSLTALLFAFDDGALLKWLVLASVLCWIAIVLDLFMRPVVAKVASPRVGLLLLATLLLVTSVVSLYWLRGQFSATVLVFTIALAAAADIGAYFSGRRFGRRKLAVQISAGKTLEGAVGGMLLAAAVAMIAMASLRFSGVSPVALFIFSLVAALFSIAGDLFISRAKRTRGVKDSGFLLPGHGGVLDRFDGLLAAIPWIAFAVLWT